MKKKDMIAYLVQVSSVTDESLNDWSNQNQILNVDGHFTDGNITGICKWITNNSSISQQKLFIQSAGGNICDIPLICKVGSPSKKKHPKVWKQQYKIEKIPITRDEVMELIPRNIMEGDFVISNENEDDNLNIEGSDISYGSKSQNMESYTLKDMLNELKKVGKKDIWSMISPRMLYKYYLADSEAIASSFVVSELNALNKVFKNYTGRTIFKISDNKRTKVNSICEMFGDRSLLHEENVRVQNPKSLTDIAFKIVSSSQVPKAVIASSIARTKYILHYKDWIKKATVPMKVYIEHCNEFFEMFSFPEYSHIQK